jgi:hypothetical protein
MKSYREVPPKRLWSLSALAVVLLSGGCKLDIVENPNAPDAKRAFVDPAGLSQLLGGAVRTWVTTRGGYFSSMVLDVMADNYTASWNNAAMRLYSSVGVECPSRCGWTNSSTAPEAAGGPNVEEQWYGNYTVLSSANDILGAIKAGICFDTNCAVDNTRTSRNKAIAKMLQGMALAAIALNYDQGFIVDEDTDISNVATLPFNTRQEIRDAAIKKFDEAYTEAGVKSWATPPEWHGVGGGRSYSNAQIRQLIRTMQAELLALFPRNAAENAQVTWAQVATYASQGVSSGAAFDWEFYVDPSGNAFAAAPLDQVKVWGNSIGTMRVDTRVAKLITSNHQNPWPEPNGNPCPTISADKRVGDGSWGPEDDFNGYATQAATANAGTDFACSGVVIFPAARGQYHQSNLQHIRYNYLGYLGENLPQFDMNGQDPFYTIQMNDLLWAEGLIRGGGSKLLGAQKINNSRVGRGGLPPLTGAESDAVLLAALQYEQEIEFMGQGGTPFYNRRRIDGLLAGTPRQMPVPAKELDVLVREIYTFGGPGQPDMSISVAGGLARVRSVREIWNQYQAHAREFGSRKR